MYVSGVFKRSFFFLTRQAYQADRAWRSGRQGRGGVVALFLFYFIYLMLTTVGRIVRGDYTRDEARRGVRNAGGGPILARETPRRRRRFRIRPGACFLPRASPVPHTPFERFGTIGEPSDTSGYRPHGIGAGDAGFAHVSFGYQKR